MYKFIIYYKCPCGKKFSKVEEQYKDKAECWCKGTAEAVSHIDVDRWVNKPHNRMIELPSYLSPITGEWVDGRVARRNDLASSNCVEYDPGMKEEQDKRHAREDAQLDKKVDEHVEREIYAMPTEKREKLAAELEHSDVAVTRI